MLFLGNEIQAPTISSNVDVEEVDMIGEINVAKWNESWYYCLNLQSTLQLINWEWH